LSPGARFWLNRQQQSQVEQLGLFEFSEKFGEAAIPFGFWIAQAMRIFDREKRVLVDGGLW